MTTHDETVLAPHLGTAHLAESLTAAIEPACPGELQWVYLGDGTMTPAWPGRPQPERWPKLATQPIESYQTNPKGATMTESPAEQVARLAAETEGAEVYYACDNCEFVLWVSDGTEGDTGTQCSHDPQGITGPYYYFPPTKPAPPSSRATLAANIERLRICRFWSLRDLALRAAEIGGMGVEHWIWSLEALDNESLEDPSFRIAGLDALAKALDTTPAELLTPQETGA